MADRRGSRAASTPARRRADPRVVGGLLAGVDEAFDRKSWHGTTLRGALRGLSAARALRRPAQGRHNIWELAVHAAYWKYVVWRRLAGEKRGSFPLTGSNWFVRDDGTEREWKQDLALLDQMHVRLRAAVAALDPRRVDRPIDGSTVTPAWLVRGIAAHDLYHAGQIQLVKRLTRPCPRPSSRSSRDHSGTV